MYGGRDFNRQISLVDECQLTKIAELPFNFELGSCAKWQNEIYLCFTDTYGDSTTLKECFYSTGPLGTFEKLPNSTTYDHSSARIAATSGTFRAKLVKLSNSPLDFLMAVGSYWGHNDAQPHGKTELLSRSKAWSIESDYPFGKKNLNCPRNISLRCFNLRVCYRCCKKHILCVRWYH